MVKAKIHIEIAYAASVAQQLLIPCVIDAYSNVAQAIRQSGLLDRYPELTLATIKCGVFGVRKNLLDLLADGDRIEIYRPLQNDPKTIRRNKAADFKR